MKRIYVLATELQSKRDALDDQRDKELKELEPLKKYSLSQNGDAIRKAARERMRNNEGIDYDLNGKVMQMMRGVFEEIPDVYKDRCEEVRQQYSNSLTALEKGYRPLFKNELDRIAAKVEKIEVEQESGLLDARTMQEIQLLALRSDAVSKATLDSFAEKVKSSESALALLDQIAERSTQVDEYGRRRPSHRYRNMLTVKQNNKQKAEDALKQLKAGVNNYLSNHADRASRIQQEHYNLVHGTQIESARWKFADMNAFYRRIEVDDDSVKVLSALE
ncbi:MAG: hypothetical protein IJX83_04155 [Lachnospiraceae bacterium]|nr:hypothetical protein [Lachnospiraceae bacterium]